jgi:hypothetical protein
MSRARNVWSNSVTGSFSLSLITEQATREVYRK